MRSALVPLLFLLASTASAETVVVGSKTFAESRILAELMAQLIEARTEIEVERRAGLGGTLVVLEALKAGEIDLYPEYTGTAWSVVLKQKQKASSLETFATTQREFASRYQLEWLSPFGFNNTYVIAVRTEEAKARGLTKVSQLGPHLEELRVGVSHEFLNREDGWPGLTRAYALPKTSPRGMEHGLAYEAVAKGQIDLIDSFSTDGKLLKLPLVLLDDDGGFFPPYDCAPVVRADTLAAHPELRDILGVLAFRIDDVKMQQLNAAVEVDGRDFAEVARAFLVDEGLLDKSAAAPTSDDGSREAPIGRLLGEHIFLTLVALVLAVLFGVPLGLLLTRLPRLAGPVIGATGVIQTVPSLALLAFMIPIPGLGLGSRSAILALFLYALLPIVRNTFTGVSEVDADLVDAARGMGLTGAQRLRLVELPLAIRTIMAGVRTSAVIGVGVATLAAFIGAGGLGDPIITGLQLNDTGLILRGAIPAALLAIATDLSLGLVERLVAPRV